MLAIIKTGGKQYRVAPGDKIKIDPPASLREILQAKKIEKPEGEEISFNDVLLIEKDKNIEIGTPYIEKAKVLGKILKQGKAPKIIIFKYKPKTRYKKKTGHRQLFTEIEITKIINNH
ncbi:MAG: 50S ribosomal protein L21 [Patescibacteria group bacterium]|nr:50S ribosomal protein L21 [Patescibacteria group bacterium]